MLDVAKKKSAGWSTVSFGDVVRLSKERSSDPEADGYERYVGLEQIDPGDLRIRRWGNVAEGVTFNSVFRPGQVLFGKRRAYQRKVAVADFSGVCSGDIYVFEPKGERLLPDLLPFICQTDAFFQHAVGTSAGSLSPRTNWNNLADFGFALPPIEEQRRILRALAASERLVDSLRSLLDRTRIAQAATFDALVAGASAKPTPLGALLVGSPRNGCSAPQSSAPTGHWVLALSAISPLGYRADQLKPVEPTPEMKSALIREGDLVISRSNTRAFVGLPTVFPERRNDVSYPDTMMRIAFDPAVASTAYMQLCLRSAGARRQIQSYAAGTSNSMKKINGENIRKVLVPLPAYEDQEVITEKLGAMTLSVRDTERRKAQASELKQQLLALAFQARGAAL